jgi:drug/metabolite transporter (DMT)-like permease
MSGRALSILLLLAAVLIWGSTYVVTKSGVEDMPPMLFALLRYCVASLLLVPLALARGGLRRLPRPVPWGILALMGLTGVALYYTAFNLGLTYTTASQAAMIQSSIPAVTALLAVVWLGERPSARRIVGISLAIVGVVLVVAGEKPEAGASRAPAIGNLLLFGTVLTWSIYTVLAKRLADADFIAVMAAVSVAGTLMLIPAALVEAAAMPVPSIPGDGWLRIAYLGAFSSALSYLFYNRALRDLDASQVGAFSNLAPVVGVVSGAVFLGETITPLALSGGAVALIGVWMCR